MLSEEELKGAPLLVFCNKQDVDGALKPEEISEQLGLAGGEKSRPWSVRGSCATKGEGLEEGLDWCVSFLKKLIRSPEAQLLGLLMQYSRSREYFLTAFYLHISSPYLPYIGDLDTLIVYYALV